MSYKKYYLLKKQVSHDFGETWEDVTPSVTKRSDIVVATYDSYSECMYGISIDDLDVPAFASEFSNYKRLEWSDNFSVLDVQYCAGCNSTCPVGRTISSRDGWGGSLNTATDIFVVFGECVTEVTQETPSYSSNTMDAVSKLHIYLPESLQTIGDNTFKRFTNIDALVIPSGVTTIGVDALRCNKLIMNGSTPPTLGSQSHMPYNIYVPSDSVNTYKNAPVWSNYANRINGFEI